MPLSAVVGRRDYMQLLPAVGFGMTFRGETLSLAAARAVLDFVRAQDVPGKLARSRAALRREFDRLACEKGLGLHLAGPDARLTIVFHPHPRLTPDEQRLLFVQECMKRGVLTNGNLMA